MFRHATEHDGMWTVSCSTCVWPVRSIIHIFPFNLSLCVLTDVPKELDCYIQLFYSLFCIYNLPIFQYLPQFTARLVSFRIFSRHVSRVKSECILFECQKHFSPLKYQHWLRVSTWKTQYYHQLNHNVLLIQQFSNFFWHAPLQKENLMTSTHVEPLLWSMLTFETVLCGAVILDFLKIKVTPLILFLPVSLNKKMSLSLLKILFFSCCFFGC